MWDSNKSKHLLRIWEHILSLLIDLKIVVSKLIVLERRKPPFR